ncbi:MAG: serine/threonine-protein kinase [Gemmatimonadota bacterium]
MPLFAHDAWRTLEPLLDEVLELEGSRRAAWLAELAERAPGLAAELTRLLADEMMADRRGFLSGSPDVSLAGMRLGAYELQEPLGQGGMGTVWLANRVDGRFKGRAAVKLPHLALLSSQGQERFRQEGSVLARLTHPGIARLLDAGVTVNAQPYLILEYVDGQSIDQYADQHQLTRFERVRLFLQVLAAVGHAHTNLIVHRDLKPSNILVDASGTVKLLDFGIAKLLDAETGANSTALTVEGARLFTPDFAAPEQVWGDLLTTATDVYALGVLLYLMLSGQHPTNQSARSPAQALAALIEREPKPLGLGDLDTVLAKALRKSPGERYQTVAAFADDLQCCLEQKPVSARPHSAAYRAARFIQRNRLAVSATALTMIALVLATVFSLAQMREARRQRDGAMHSSERSQAMSELQVVLAGDSRGGDGHVLTMPERYALAEHVLGRQYGSHPALRSELLADLAGRFFEIGDRTSQRAMLARAGAIASATNLPGQVAEAACARANSFAFDDEIDSARHELTIARPALARALADHPDPRLEATCANAEGQTLIAAGVNDSGIVELERAAALVRDDVHGLRYEMLNNLASGLRLVGRTREAIPYWREVLHDLDSTGYGDTELVPNLSTFLFGALAELGEMSSVDSEMQPLIEEQEAVHGPGKVSTLLAFLYGQNKLRLGQLDSADLWMSRAMKDTTQGAGAFAAWLPQALTELRLEQGRIAEAREASKNVTGGPRGRRAIRALLMARLLWAEGHPSQAAAQLESTLDSLRADGGPPLSHFALPLVYAGEWRLATGDARGADSLAGLALAAAISGDSLGDVLSGLAGRADLLSARARKLTGDLGGATTAADNALIALRGGYGRRSRWAMEAFALRDSLPR